MKTSTNCLKHFTILILVITISSSLFPMLEIKTDYHSALSIGSAAEFKLYIENVLPTSLDQTIQKSLFPQNSSMALTIASEQLPLVQDKVLEDTLDMLSSSEPTLKHQTFTKDILKYILKCGAKKDSLIHISCKKKDERLALAYAHRFDRETIHLLRIMYAKKLTTSSEESCSDFVYALTHLKHKCFNTFLEKKIQYIQALTKTHQEQYNELASLFTIRNEQGNTIIMQAIGECIYPNNHQLHTKILARKRNIFLKNMQSLFIFVANTKNPLQLNESLIDTSNIRNNSNQSLTDLLKYDSNNESTSLIPHFLSEVNLWITSINRFATYKPQ